MRNRNHSRNDLSADSASCAKRNHLSDEEILLALDGELSSRATAAVEAHLEACWSCRTRRQQIENAITGIVEYRDCLIRSHRPVSGEGVENFAARLEQLARSVGQSSLRNRVAGRFRRVKVFLLNAVPRQVWASAVILAMFGLALFIRVWPVSRVSASQLLDNSRVFEARKLHSVAKPVVYQKLHIRIGAKAVTRTIYRDSVGMRQVDHLEATGGSSPSDAQNYSDDRADTPGADVQQTFVAAHLNWQDPLSPDSYSSWHDSLHDKQDEITTDNQDFLTLKTTTAQGSITEARITFRTIDFHPVTEELRLRDAREVEIKEMAWDVLPMEAVNPAIFSQEPVRHAEFERPLNLSAALPGPSDAQLAESELQARVAMHVAGADLGEQIELERDTTGPNQRSVVVRGIVSSAGRKNDLLRIFQGIPHLDLRLQSLEEAKAQQNPSGADEVLNPNSHSDQQIVQREMQTRSGNPLLSERDATVFSHPAFELQLEERYPTSEDRIGFSNKVVELAQDALAEAWALRRLRDRYTPDAVAELSHGSRQTLELLIRDHVSLFRQHVNATQDLISPLLPPGSMPQPTVADRLQSTAVLIGDWRNSISETFSETQRLCDTVVALLARSGAPDSENQSLVDDLQLALGKLQIQLLELYEAVTEPMIATPSSSSRDQR